MFGTLRVIDVSDPKNPKIIGSIDMPTHLGTSYLSGSLIITNSGGIQIIDVGNPEKPKIVGVLPDLYAVWLSGSVVYADSGFIKDKSLRMIDIGDPKNPKISGTADIGPLGPISVFGDYGYSCSTNINGLQVTDLSDFRNPKVVGGIADIPCGSVSVSGSTALAPYQNGYYVIDIGQPENPVIIGKIEKSGGTAAIIGDTIVFAYNGLLRVVPSLVRIKPSLIDDKTLSVTLPSPPVPGKYTVRVFGNNGEASELVGAVTFASEEPESITVGEDLALNICARYHGQTFGFVLNYAPNPHGMSGFFWKADLSAFRQIDSTSSSCIDVGDDLTLSIRAGYRGAGYAFTMSFYPYPDAASASEFFWKADPASLRVIY
jgi:hypothetical protein